MERAYYKCTDFFCKFFFDKYHCYDSRGWLLMRWSFWDQFMCICTLSALFSYLVLALVYGIFMLYRARNCPLALVYAIPGSAIEEHVYDMQDVEWLFDDVDFVLSTSGDGKTLYTSSSYVSDLPHSSSLSINDLLLVSLRLCKTSQ